MLVLVSCDVHSVNHNRIPNFLKMSCCCLDGRSLFWVSDEKRLYVCPLIFVLHLYVCALMASEAGIRCCCLYLALLLQQPDPLLPPLTLVLFLNPCIGAERERCLKTDHRSACIRFSNQPRENKIRRKKGNFRSKHCTYPVLRKPGTFKSSHSSCFTNSLKGAGWWCLGLPAAILAGWATSSRCYWPPLPDPELKPPITAFA